MTGGGSAQVNGLKWTNRTTACHHSVVLPCQLFSFIHLFLFSSSSVHFLVSRFVLLTFACFVFFHLFSSSLCFRPVDSISTVPLCLISIVVSSLRGCRLPHHFCSPSSSSLVYCIFFSLHIFAGAVCEPSPPQSRPVITCRRTPSHIHTLSSDECRRLLSHDTGHQVLRGGPDVVPAEVSLSRSDR